MNQDGEQGRNIKHSHNSSINSASSISEPTTPPTSQYVSRHMKIWDPSKISGNLSFPSFNVDPNAHPLPNQSLQFSNDSSSDKENQVSPGQPGSLDQQSLHWEKIDKEYLASMTKTPLSDMRDNIMKLAKDQHGCRFLQKRIDEHSVPNSQARLANFAIIFEQIEDNLYELIIDPFGNYLIQKLIDYCDESILNKFMEALSSNLFQISINQHGTRALQKIIDKLSNDYQLSLLVRGLLNFIIELIKDLNGNHVIQKILNKYSPENCQFIYDAITRDLLVVATHKHGCCVLQKCLNHVNEAQRVKFSNVILKYSNFVRLANDQFGNYVLQYLISTNSIDVNVKLFANISKCGIWGLCTSKFSSNVIEKLLKNCYANEYKLKPKTDLSPGSEGITFSNLKFTMIHCIFNSDLNKIVNDPYGNYVIQTLIDILINPNGVYFSESSSGERIILPALSTLLDEYFQSSIDTLQVQIIKKWLYNCQITSPFGKRIQMKMNTILNGSTKPHSKATNKDARKPSHVSSQKQKYIPQQKRSGFRDSNLASSLDSYKGNQRYQFRELTQSMTNLNIKNATVKPESLEWRGDYQQHMNQPFFQGKNYMEFEHFNPSNQSRQYIIRDQSKPLVPVNDSKHIHANHTNHATLGANASPAALESTKDVLYPGQQYSASMSSSLLDRLQSGSVYDSTQYMHRQHRPATEQYSAFNFNQVSTIGRKEMAGHQKLKVGIEASQYHPTHLSYNNSTGQVYGLAGFSADDSSPINQSKRYYSSFG